MQTKHILPLTGIRFFAAIWVVLLHIPMLRLLCPWLQTLSSLVNLGFHAVPFFFILSGFILSHNYLPYYSLSQHPKFVFLRFARLWPVHVVMLLLVAPLFSWPASRVEELFMVRSWYSREVLWNGPAWSISAEWFAYLCLFPLASLFFGRIRSVPSLVIVVTLFLAAHAYSFGEILFSNLSRCGEICFLFPAGCGLYRIYTLVKNPPAEKIVLLGLLLFSLYVICSDELTVFILYVAFALLIFGLAYERGFLARLLSTRIVVWGGLISYSLYMTHALIIRIAVVHTLSYWQRWSHQELTFMRYAVLSVMLVALIGMAAAFYYLIEVPANKKLRAFWATLENAHWKFGQE